MNEPLHTATAITGEAQYRTELVIGDDPAFQQIADASLDSGGKDLGASPVAQLTGALAACKTITAKMYANRKGWPLESVRIDVKHVQRVVDGKHRDVFEAEVTLTGELDDEQRRRIYEICAKCPVHKMLAGETAVESSLAEG